MPTSTDALDDPDILLVRLLAGRNRDELTALVRAHPQLLDEPVKASPGELAAQRPDPAVARAHLRALRGLHGELMALAGRADELQRAFTASGNVAELTAAVSAWRAALAHPGVTVTDAALLTTVHRERLTPLSWAFRASPVCESLSLYRYGSRVAIRIRLASGRCPLIPISARGKAPD